MGQELGAVAGIRSMLSARTSIERVLARDVSRILPGRQLASIDAELVGAMRDATEGAKAVLGLSDEAADRLTHAVALLQDGRTLTANREMWNADRSGIALARDSVQDALVEARATLAPERAESAEKVVALAQQYRQSGTLTAQEWMSLADAAELPIGLRPVALEHVKARDLKLLREQATRIADRLPGSSDARLPRIMAGARIVTEATTREVTEQYLRETATQILARAGKSGDGQALATRLDDIGAMQHLDSMLRPRALAKSGDVDWSDAAQLARRGGTIPASWDGIEHLHRLVHLEHPQVALDSLLQTRPESYTAQQWRTLASLVRLAPDERPSALAALGRREAREMETVAGMLDKGTKLPESWKGVSRINEVRGAVLFGSKSTATEYLATILRADPGQVTAAQLSDLDALRLLPSELRPDLLDPTDARWAKAALTGNLVAPGNATAFEALVRLGIGVKTPAELRATLGRIDWHIRELERIQVSYHAQAPRDVLRAFEADLSLLRAFDLGKPATALLEQTRGLVRHNLDRLDGLVSGGYGRHADYAELGRAKENVRLLTEIARERALGESDTVARARVAREGAPSVASDAASASEGVEVLSW